MAKEYLTANGQLILVDGKMVEIPSETEVSDTADEQTELLAATQESSNNLPDQVVGYINGSPRGVYESLSALQTALPNGAVGVYLTTDNGHWYYWNDTAWCDGGVYQASEIADGTRLNDVTIANGLVDTCKIVDCDFMGDNIFGYAQIGVIDVTGALNMNDITETSFNGTPKADNNLVNKKYVDEADMTLALQQADIMEEINGYITALTDETYSELDSAIITDSVEINGNMYNYADGTRAGLVSIEGNTKKSSNKLPVSTAQSRVINGIEYTNLQDGGYKLNGTATSSFTIWNTISLITLNGDYYYKPFTSGTYSGTIAHSFRFNQTQNNINLNFNFVSLPNQKNILVNSILMYIVEGTTFNNFIVKPMLVEGDTAPTTFEPYYDGLKSAYTEGISLTNNTETYTINVPKTELCGVGSAKDIINISKNSNGYYDIDLTKNIGTRDYQADDESNSEVLTDMTTTYYKLDTPTTTRIASGLTYEQMTAICRIGGTISNLGNDNEAYNVNPDVTIKRVYRLWNKEN